MNSERTGRHRGQGAGAAVLPPDYPTPKEERPQKATDVSPCQYFKEGSACVAER